MGSTIEETIEDKSDTLRKDTRRRREAHDIVVAILEMAMRGQRKTHIMTKVGLSYSQLKKYLNCLKEQGFITEKSGIWKTTKKGIHVIEACELCRRIAHGIK